MMLALALLAAAPGAGPDSTSAMEAKLRSSIEQWFTQNENSPGWSDQQRSQAEIVAKSTAVLRSGCIIRRRDKFGRSREPLSNVVTAIQAGCQEERQLLRRAIIASFRGLMEPNARYDQADRILERSLLAERDALTAFFVEQRLPKR